MPENEQLSLRTMTFEGIPYDDDYHVIWRGLPIGRILKQSGVAWGQPDWFWTINFDGRPVTGNQKGVGRDLEDCKAKFKAAWATYGPGLSEDDVARFRRHIEQAEHRSQR